MDFFQFVDTTLLLGDPKMDRVLQMWPHLCQEDGKINVLPLICAALLLMQLNMQPSLHSPNSCSYLLSNWILRSFAAEDPASQSFGCKYAGSSALKGGSAFLCAERLKIFVDSFVLEVRTPPSSSLALLLSSAPLSLMSSENVPRLHSFLSSKPIYRTI